MSNLFYDIFVCSCIEKNKNKNKYNNISDSDSESDSESELEFKYNFYKSYDKKIFNKNDIKFYESHV